MLILIRGAGDIATGVALRLYRSGMQVVMTDLPRPTAIRRTVCFSPAITDGETVVEDVRAVRADSPVSSAKELIERAKSEPGRINLGICEIMGPTHIPALRLKADGVPFNHVPIDGAGKAPSAR